MPFAIGDRVQLKSGGPVMTVEEIDEGINTVFCRWFDDNNKLQGHHFVAATLQKV